MTGAWSVVMVLLGLWPGTLSTAQVQQPRVVAEIHPMGAPQIEPRATSQLDVLQAEAQALNQSA